MHMEPHHQFPTYHDIYSIYKTPTIKKLGKKKKIPKLLKTLLETYPDVKKYVAEKSLNSKYLHKLLTKLISKLIQLNEKPHSSSTEDFFQISFVPSISLCDSLNKVNVDQIATTSFQDCKPSLTEQASCNGPNPRTFCVANIWAGFPTFGSIYSTSKLEVVQQQKDDDKEFILAMLKILMKKYPRLKTIFSDLSSSHSITETLLYILRQAEKLELSSDKQEKRQFFSTIFNLENISIISKYMKEKTDSELSHKDIENVSAVSDMDKSSVKEISVNFAMNDSSLVCVDKSSSSIRFHFDPECKSATTDITSENNGRNKTYLYEYLKKLKSKYAWTQSELAEKSDLEINLEKKLKYLLMKQRKYKGKIKRCRKEMSELDAFKSICRS